MQSLQIKTYSSQLQITKPHFFILNRGLNSGKPSEKFWVNSFVCICKDETERDFYYWLLFGLWKAKHFHQFLVGSVIPFIRLDDLKTIISEQAQEVKKKEAQYNSAVQKIKSIEEKEKQMLKQLVLLQDLKRAMLYRYLKR